MTSRKPRFERLEQREMLSAASVDQQYDLGPATNGPVDYPKLDEKWMPANVASEWVYIRPDGALYEYVPGKSTRNDILIEQFMPAEWENTALLWDAFHDEVPPPEETPHADDPDKAAEHAAVMALVPVSSATHTAVASGLWSNPATWGGSVPGAMSRVVIPAGQTVTVDNGSADWIRVEGVLDFVITQDNTLTVETIVVAPGGTLRNHSQATSQILFRDDGPISDPFALERGLISHGTTDIEGLDKTDWTTFEPTAVNAASITVADATGWQVGDRLTLTGAAVEWFAYQYHLVNQVEERTITAISGNLVTLNTPLEYAHKAVEWQNPVVANLSRNITFKSVNPAVDRRGHVMLMHNDDHIVSNAAFEDLGRTDKNMLVTDPDGLGGGLENPRGRYALHFHRTGPENNASQVRGVVVEGSPGWGLVNHESNVIADSNVVYDVFGAAFVSETALDVGSFTNNAAILSVGTADNVADFRGNNDFGHSGNGFWLQGSDIVTTGNVASNHSSAAYMFFLDTADILKPFAMSDNTALWSATSLFVWASAFTTNDPAQPYSLVSDNLLQGGVALGYPNFIELNGNTIVAIEEGFDSYGVQHTGVNASMKYVNNTIKGFRVGLEAPTEGNNLIQGGYYDNLWTNILVHNTYAERPRQLDINAPTFGTRATWDIQMRIAFFTYNLAPAYPEADWIYGTAPAWQPLFEEWSLGEFSEVRLNGVDLYFEEQGADFEFGERLTRFPNEIRKNPDGSWATGESLNARGLYVGGKPLPAGTQYHLPKVRGVLVA